MDLSYFLQVFVKIYVCMMWWYPYCYRWWSGAGSMKFPNFGYKESGPLSPPISLWWFLFIFKKTTESVIASFKSCHSLSPQSNLACDAYKTKYRIILYFFLKSRRIKHCKYDCGYFTPVDVPLDPLASCFGHFTCHTYTKYTETNRIYKKHTEYTETCGVEK